MPDSTQISIRSSASGHAIWIDCLRLDGAVVDIEYRRVETGIGDKNADEQLDEGRPLGQSAEHEQVHGRQREADKGQDQAEEKEARQRILPAKARDLELLQRALIGQRAPQVQPFDDVAHADRLLLAQALAPAIGVAGKPRALLGAQFITLERHGFHARLELVAGQAPGSSVKTVANTAIPTSNAIRKAGSVRDLTTCSVMPRS